MSDSLKQFRWDTAWRLLTNPKYSWCRRVITTLVGRERLEHEMHVDIDTCAIVAVSENDVDEHAGITNADRLIQITADSGSGKLHLEFQSSVDNRIGYRLLRYGLSHLVSYNFKSDDGVEFLQLPYSVVVDVKPNVSNAKYGSRRVQMQMGSSVTGISYPVVHVSYMCRELRALSVAQDTKELDAATDDVFSWLNPLPEETRVCSLICGLLSASRKQPQATIFREEDIVMEINRIEERSKGVITLAEERGEKRGIQRGMERGVEEGRQRGLKEAFEENIQNLMRNTGWSREQAERALSGAHETKSNDVRTMNLN